MWTFTHTENTTASPAQVWQRYSDPSSWPEWDQETETVRLDGPFAAGSRGRLKPKGGPAAKFQITAVAEQESFSDVSFLPLARIVFKHEIQPSPEGSSFTHTVSIEGPLSPLFARVIGKKIASGLPTSMRRLAELSVQT